MDSRHTNPAISEAYKRHLPIYSQLFIISLLSHFISPPLPSTASIKMPSDTHVNNALSLIENDRTKILGLNVGNHKNIQPGQYIPRGGEH